MKILKIVAFCMAMTGASMEARAGNTLAAEQVLTAGQNLLSTNGYYSFVMQGDGNLVLYRLEFGTATPIWATGQGGSYVRMQIDGNLAVYKSNNTWFWTSGTGGRPFDWGYKLVVGDDGSLAIRDGSSNSVWRTSPDACGPGVPIREFGTCSVVGGVRITTPVFARCTADADRQARAIGATLGACVF